MAEGLVKIVGLEQVQRFFEEAPKNLVLHGFIKALNAAAEVFAADLEVRAPIKESYTDAEGKVHTVDGGGILDRGELRENVMIALQLDSQFRGGNAQVGFGKKAGNVANWLEFGHRIVTHAGNTVGFVDAEPFMRPSFEQNVDKALDAFVGSITVTINEGW